jgi:hypothetical protein
MPVDLEMKENARVMFWRFVDPWSLAELKPLTIQARDILQEATFTVHSFADLRQAHHVPSGVLSTRQVTTWHHPRSGQLVILGASPFIKIMLETIFRIARFDRFRLFDDEAEALAYLRGLIAEETAQNFSAR